MENFPWTVSSESQRRVIEESSLGLVREFLQHWGLYQTLAKLDVEAPRTKTSICNRSQLAQSLHVAPLIRRNSHLLRPFQSVVEMIVWDVLQSPRFNQAANSRPVSAHPRVRPSSKERALSVQPKRAIFKVSEADEMRSGTRKSVDSENMDELATMSRNFPKTAMQTKKKVKLEEKNTVESSSLALKNLSDVSDMVEERCLRWLAGYDDTLLEEQPESNPRKKWRDLKVAVTAKNKPRPKVKKVEFKVTKKAQPLDYDTAVRLRKLIFGPTYSRTFNDAWIKQAFTFRDCQDERTNRLRYGLIQKKGGPCAIVTIVQGFVLKHMIFGKVGNNGKEVKSRDQSVLNVSEGLRTSCLAESIIEMLWKAGRSFRAIVATISATQSFKPGPSFPYDGVSEYIVMTPCTTVESLHATVYEHIGHFEYSHGAAISLLYSVILSRGISEVLLDMDERTNCLLGKNCSSTVELLNLFLTGSASSNMFDDRRIAADTSAVHRGITSQSDVGFLAVNAGNAKPVGNNLTHPSLVFTSDANNCYLTSPGLAPHSPNTFEYPIWVVAKDNTFSLFFGLHRDIATAHVDNFVLHYYAGLIHQDKEVKLTVDCRQKTPRHLRETMSPLENCIMERWRKALLTWHVVQPTL